MSHSLVFHHCHCCLPPPPSSPDLPMSTTTSNLSPLSTTTTSSASHIWLHSGYLGLSPTIWVTRLSLPHLLLCGGVNKTCLYESWPLARLWGMPVSYARTRQALWHRMSQPSTRCCRVLG